MVTISFPGLGIDAFTVDPVAFTLPIFGGIEIRWYGLIITAGILFAFLYCSYRSKQEGILFDDILDITLFTVIFGVIGARAYYVLTSLDSYDSFGEMIAIWNGGLAIYGGIIAGALTVYLVCRHKKIPPLKMMDATAPGVMIGQLLGRWGNFFNGEAYGSEVLEDSLFYPLRMGLIPNIESYSTMHYFHPTFLYESVWNLIGFLLINAFYKKKKFDGQILLMYLTWYGFGRMLIEGLRTDSLYVGPFRISQVVGFLCFAVGSALLIYCGIRAKKGTLTIRPYTPVPKAVPQVAGMRAKTHTPVTAEEPDAADASANDPATPSAEAQAEPTVAEASQPHFTQDTEEPMEKGQEHGTDH